MKNDKEMFTGKIERCLNIYNYIMYGKERLVPDSELGHIKFHTLYQYTQTAYEDAILLKINEDNYIWLNAPQEETTPLLQRLGIFQKHITTTPEKDYDLFIDKNSLIPYFPAPKKEKHPFTKKLTRKMKKDK